MNKTVACFVLVQIILAHRLPPRSCTETIRADRWSHAATSGQSGTPLECSSRRPHGQPEKVEAPGHAGASRQPVTVTRGRLVRFHRPPPSRRRAAPAAARAAAAAGREPAATRVFRGPFFLLGRGHGVRPGPTGRVRPPLATRPRRCAHRHSSLRLPRKNKQGRCISAPAGRG